MQTVSATEVQHEFDDALDAAQREPVIIRKQDRDVAVLMSMQEFEKLRGLRLDVFDRLAEAVAAKAATRGMTDETLTQVMKDVS
jgi:prevent-host-death family protein